MVSSSSRVEIKSNMNVKPVPLGAGQAFNLLDMGSMKGSILGGFSTVEEEKTTLSLDSLEKII